MKKILMLGLMVYFSVSIQAQPVNNACAGAIPIAVSATGTGCGVATFTLPFTTDGTTDSGLDNTCNTINTGLDQFFTWTATSSALSFTSTAPGNPGITVLTNIGTTMAPVCGVEIGCLNTFGSGGLTGWTIGDDLIIQIYDFGASFSDVAFCLEETTIPGNNDCGGATSFTESPDSGCVNGISTTCTGASLSTDNACGGSPDVWFEFTASSTHSNIETSNFGGLAHTSIVGVYSGSCGALTLEACMFAPVSLPTTMGTDYLISVSTRSDANGVALDDFDLCAYPCPAPSNNTCATATVLTESADSGCAMAVSGSTECATLTPEGTSFGQEVWYSFSPSTSDVYAFEISVNGDVNLYSGTCAGLTPLALSDPLTSGTTYLINVVTRDAFGFPNQGPFDLCAFVSPVPLNNDCTGATPVVESPDDSCVNGVTATTRSTTISVDNACGGSEDVWFRFTAASSHVNIETSNFGGVAHTSVVGIYSGSCGTLTLGECMFSPLSFPTTIGVDYFVSVTTRTEDNFTGGDDFDFCIYACPAPSNNTCGTATALMESLDSGCGMAASGTTECATITADGTSFGQEVWYSFAPTSSGVYFFELSVLGDINLYTGACGALTPILLTDPLTLGTTYLINVVTRDAFGFPTQGPFDLCAYPEPTCPSDYAAGNQLTGTITTTEDYETDGAIESTQILDATAMVDYDSGVEINMSSPFETIVGALFHAFIDGCGGTMFQDTDDTKRSIKDFKEKTQSFKKYKPQNTEVNIPSEFRAEQSK